MSINDVSPSLILRIEAGKDALTSAWLYQSGQTVWQQSAPTMRALITILADYLHNDFSGINGVYAYAGPAGFTKLRATHVTAAALGLSNDIPVAGYTDWQDTMAATIPADEGSVQPIYPELKN